MAHVSVRRRLRVKTPALSHVALPPRRRITTKSQDFSSISKDDDALSLASTSTPSSDVRDDDTLSTSSSKRSTEDEQERSTLKRRRTKDWSSSIENPIATIQRAKAKVAAAAQRLLEVGHVPGVAIAIIKDGHVAHTECAGLRRLETRWQIEKSTIFQLASISKTVTGVCAMQLVERGLLRLDADINDVIESKFGFTVCHPLHVDVPITLRMLMSHTSSINDDDDVYDDTYTAGTLNGSDSKWELSAFLREYFHPRGRYYNAQVNFLNDSHAEELEEDYRGSAPGQTFCYSNIGAGLVGLLIEGASGLDFPEYARQHVFQPLGMSSSSFTWAGFEQSGVSTERVAMPYSWIDAVGDEKGYFKPHGLYGSVLTPDGFLRASVTDLATYLITIMNGGSHPQSNATILSQQSVEEMHKLHYPTVCDDYGLMWSLSSGYGVGYVKGGKADKNPAGERKLVGHGGNDPGLSTNMNFDPKTGVGVIILKNGDLGDECPFDELEECHCKVCQMDDKYEAADDALFDAAWELADAL